MYPPAVADRYPDRLAYIMAGSGQTLTYAQLDRESNRLAHLFRQHGIRAGDTVAVVLENRIEWPVVVAAGMRSGLYVTPVNWHLNPAEIAQLLADARPAALITSVAIAADLAPLAGLAGLAGVAGLAGDLNGIATWCVDGDRAGFADLRAAMAVQPATAIDDEALGARVLYSGGTTGRPKAFRQKLLGIHPAAAPPRHAELTERLDVGAGTVLLSPAPSYHAAPFTFQLITLAAGGTVVCMERFDAAAALTAMRAYGVTHSQWVPTMLVRLLRLGRNERGLAFPAHRVAFTSGAPCPPEVKLDIMQWWGPVLHEYYGASEGYGHTYISPQEAFVRPGSVGRPLSGTRIHITDPAGHELPAGQAGRVCFAAPADIAYRNAGDGAASELRSMGDVGYVDAEGFLFLVGRETMTIVSGGVNIYPPEIEAVLLTHPDIVDASVIGEPDPEFGERVVAVVEPRPGTDSGALSEKLVQLCRERLAHFKAPRRVVVVDRLPRRPNGKLNTDGVRALVRSSKENT
jgi:long-chain acyl-CoA synthetase